MKNYGRSGNVAPRTLNIETRRGWGVSFTLRPL